ncbi:MAG: hypothetical protein HY699_20000 [Deltaproteobacteria bacterium]|nr:hypothetical protein [Deltaproteobacteria bacterium]
MSAAGARPQLDAYDQCVDRAFRRWVSTALAAELRAVAYGMPHGIGLSAAPQWQSWRAVFTSPVIRALPGVIAQGFPAVPAATVQALGLAQVLLVFLAFVDDRLNDGQVYLNRPLQLLRRNMEAEAQACLGAAMGERDEFWRLIRHGLREYARVHVAEAMLWSENSTGYTHADYARDAAAKLPMAKWAGLALAMLGQAAPAAVHRLGRAVDHCVVALQYADDVADWEEDCCAGRWTYFIQRLLNDAELRRRVPVSVAALRERVAFSGVAEEFLVRAQQHYDACAALLSKFAMPAWHSWLVQQRASLTTHIAARQRENRRQREQFAASLRRRLLAGDGGAGALTGG